MWFPTLGVTFKIATPLASGTTTVGTPSTKIVTLPSPSLGTVTLMVVLSPNSPGITSTLTVALFNLPILKSIFVRLPL